MISSMIEIAPEGLFELTALPLPNDGGVDVTSFETGWLLQLEV